MSAFTVILTLVGAAYLAIGLFVAIYNNALLFEMEGYHLKVWQFLVVMLLWPMTFLAQ